MYNLAYNEDREFYKSYLYKEMMAMKKSLLDRLSVIIHPKYIVPILKSLHYAEHENYREAESVVIDLDIEKIEFAALLEDDDLFEELYERQKEEDASQAAYDEWMIANERY